MTRLNHEKVSKKKLRREREILSKLKSMTKKKQKEERKRLYAERTKIRDKIKEETKEMTELEKIQYILNKK
jgi:hypothetical protein